MAPKKSQLQRAIEELEAQRDAVLASTASKVDALNQAIGALRTQRERVAKRRKAVPEVVKTPPELLKGA